MGITSRLRANGPRAAGRVRFAVVAKRVLSAVALVMLAVSTAFVATGQVAYAEDNVTEYQLYPTPHAIEYGSSVQTLRDTAVAVVEDGIDSDTVNRMNETLALKNMTATTADEVPTTSSATAVLVGIKGSGGAVDTYVQQLVDAGTISYDDDLFDQNDSYLLASIPSTDANTPDVIVVLGSTTDASFYGLTSLYQIFQQVDGAKLSAFTVQDYADVVTRGFIEGYYGEPWSTEDRINLMEWGGYYKLNAYVYAPKDDPKHNEKWYELYTDEELDELIKPLADAGNASKCRFVYALHPFMHSPITSANYDTQVQKLKDKFFQVIDQGGVRQIAILADDATNQGSALYTKLLEDMTDWLHELQAETNEDGTAKYEGLKDALIFCPPNYMGWGESWYADLPDNVQVVNTGGEVWGTVNNNFTSSFKSTSGEAPFMWVNWPCSDNTKSGLIMGGYDSFLSKDVQPGNLKGLVLNPMQQSEPSKQAIFMAADFSWNLWDSSTDSDQIWEDSFSYVDHNSPVATSGSNALRELSRHMMESAKKSGDQGESANIKDDLTDFQAKLSAGTVTEDDFDHMIDIYSDLQDAAATYRSNYGNKAMFDQIVYWIDAYDDLTSAMISYCEAGKAYLEGNTSDLVSDYAAGQEALTSYGNHGFSYIDHTEYAQVGIDYLTPTVKAVDTYLSGKVSSSTNPDAFVETYISNAFTSPTSGEIADITDGDEATSVTFKTPNYLYKDDYIGITFNRATDVDSVKFSMGSGKNYMYYGQLQVTYDGKTWENVDGQSYSEPGSNNHAAFTFEADGLGLKDAMGVRLIATADNVADLWLTINEIEINDGQTGGDEPAEDTSFSIKLDGITDSAYNGSSYANLADGSTSTIAYLYSTASKDQMTADSGVELDFNSPVFIDGASITHDSSSESDRPSSGGMVFQYKAAGSEDWVTFGTYDGETTYKATLDEPVKVTAVRAWLTQSKPNWWRIAEFTPSIVQDPAGTAEGIDTNIDDASFTLTTADGSVMLNDASATFPAGGYVSMDLGAIRNNVAIDYTAPQGLTVKTSMNGLEWNTYDASADNTRARYVGLFNDTDSAVDATVEGFGATYLFVTDARVLSSSMTKPNNENYMIDGDLTTVGGYSSYPQEGDTIVFDLGQERDITSVRYEVPETNLNFIRNAVVEVSDDPSSDDWTCVLKINDDAVENTWNDDTAKEAAWLTHDSANPGNMYTVNPKDDTTADNENDPNGTDALDVTARYMRIRFTSSYDHRWVVGDLIINNGEYVSSYADADFVQSGSGETEGHVPTNMLDGDLSTVWEPVDDEGTLTYNVSEPLAASGEPYEGIRIVSSGASSAATVTAELYTDDTYTDTVTVTLGKLNQSISDFRFSKAAASVLDDSDAATVKSITISWDNGAKPVIADMFMLTSTDGPSTDVVEQLNSAIAQADQVKDDSESWTANSKLAFDTAYAAAQEAKEEAEAGTVTDEYLTSIITSLTDAIDNGEVKYTGTELSELVDGAVSNDDGRYTTTSYSAYADAISAAQAALEDADNLSETKASELIDAINAAKDALAFDTTTAERAALLIKDIDSKGIADGTYTTASKQAFDDAYAALKKLVDAGETDPSKLSDPVKALNDAVDGLVDTSALVAARAEFEATDADAYTAASFAAYQQAYDASSAVLENGSADEVAAAIEALSNAKAELVAVDLEGLIDECEQFMASADASDYTTASWKALEDALEDAKNGTGASSEELANSLVDARANLVNIAALKDVVARAEGIDRGLYTEDSLANLDSALDAAKALYEEGTTAQVTEASQALNDALAALELIEPEVTVHTVTFNDRFGNKTQIEVEDGAQIAANQIPSDPTATGYRFDGWCTYDGDKLVAFDFSTKITDDLTLYAEWVKVTPGEENKADEEGNVITDAIEKLTQTGDDTLTIIVGVVVVAVVAIVAGVMVNKRSKK